MSKQAKLKCLRCDYEYNIPAEVAEKEERTCPKCRSNSVRMLRGEEKQP